MARQTRRKKPSAPAKKTTARRGRKLSFMSRLKRSLGMPWFKNWRMRDYLKILFLGAFWGGVALGALVFILSMGLPDIRKAADLEQQPTIIIRDKDGKEIARMGDNQGDRLSVSEMSPHLINAVIATEDRRFYKHWGVDPIGLARAVVTNLRAGGVSQGGSTITQQLAKNLFLSPERTLTRKAKEALLALYLERRYTKNDILGAYLNRAYFGAGAYGADSAARVYFNTSARNLNLEQAAMLAGLLKAPSRYSPDNDPKLTMKRTRVVLSAMVAAGYLRPGAEKMEIKPLPAREYNIGGSFDLRYYADWIMSQVDSYTGSSSQDLIIETTLDTKIQSFASKQLRDSIDKDGKALNITQGALVTMKPDGAVVAMVGGRDYGESQYNRATQSLRQPGSSFKPFIYLGALEEGYTPDTLVNDAPLRIGKYAPTNYDGKYHGTVTMQDAVAASLNTVAVRTLKEVGISKVKNIAQRMGITEPLTADLSLALGASEVHILSMTSAYATLANNGLATQPYGIRLIRTPKGQVIYQRRDVPATPVLSPYTVAQMNQMLQSVVFYGTGKGAAIDRPVAGKTGTSSNYRDAWFIGYTPDYVTSVWVGNDNNTPMKRVTGGAMPTRIWRSVMAQAESGLPIRALPIVATMGNQPVAPQPMDDGSMAAPAVPQEEPGLFDRILNNIVGDNQPPAPIAQPVEPKAPIVWDETNPANLPTEPNIPQDPQVIIQDTLAEPTAPASMN
jgi:penicillin-binding protein 1A